VAGASDLFERDQLLQRAISGRELPHRLEHIDHGHILAVMRAGQDRPAIDEDRRHVEPQHRHHHAGQALVTAREPDKRVITMASHGKFNRIGNHFAADERGFHALMAHRDAIGDGDGVEPARGAAACDHAFAADIGLRVQGGVAWRGIVARARHANEGPGDVFLGHAHRVVIGTVRRALRPDRDVAAGEFGLVKRARHKISCFRDFAKLPLPSGERRRNPLRKIGEQRGPAGVVGVGSGQVLPDFDTKIAPVRQFGMAVHGVIEITARIREVVTHGQSLRRQQRDGDAGGAVILIVEHADLPPTRLFTRGKLRGEAVEREDQRRFGRRQPLFQRGVIGPVKAGEPCLAIRADIAGDPVAVAGFGDEAGRGFLTVEVAHETADSGDVCGDGVITAEDFGDGFGADINRYVFVQQARGDAEINVLRHMVAGMVGDADDPAGGGCAALAVGQSHKPNPRSC